MKVRGNVLETAKCAHIENTDRIKRDPRQPIIPSCFNGFCFISS